MLHFGSWNKKQKINLKFFLLIAAVIVSNAFIFECLFFRSKIKPVNVQFSNDFVPANTTSFIKMKQGEIAFSEDEIAEIYSNLKNNRQKYFSKKQNVAIIVPYRNRAYHLSVFLRHMHYFLHQQTDINYGIFIVEQVQNQTFNRGKLMNVGFLEALKEGPWNCFFFHDIDLLPENLAIQYKCEYLPRHFSAAIDIFHYSVPYFSNFGGVCAMFRGNFERMNGFSNEFWGWGGEDDELRRRVFAVGKVFYRIPAKLGIYKMIRHHRDSGNDAPPLKCRLKMINETIHHFHRDGLNNIKYTLVKKQKKLLYYHFLADLLEKESKKISEFKC